ncbi:MAG: ParB N-terminal domain-containing protein [Deltaproteobacteria bacterium]|nr:ParB N-terminal domain-containing protein [Deltaproteobacteria bacterium]
MKHVKIELVATDKLIHYINNPKKHPEIQINKIASSIKNFGFLVPIVIDKGNEIIAGHGRFFAAQKLALDKIPCIRAEHLTPEQIKAFRIADNKLAESDWDQEKLTQELKILMEMEYNIEDIGFNDKEITRLFPEEEDVEEQIIPELYQILITLENEEQQKELLERLINEGYECRALIS